MADAAAAAAAVPGTPRRMSRTGSFSGVWWKLGDAAVAASGDGGEVERRLRGISDEEAAVNARLQLRAAAAAGVRRKIALTSLNLEVLAFIYAFWTARRRDLSWSKRAVKFLPVFAIPALASILYTAFVKIQKMFDVRDKMVLGRLRAEKRAKIGQFRGSHHNMLKLIEKYDPDAAEKPEPATGKLKRSHSRLSFHVGDEPI